MKARRALGAAASYLRRNPTEISRAVRNALGLRFGVPLDAFRWLAEQAASGGKVGDIEIDSVPPGIRVGANIDLMRTPVRASATVFIQRIELSSDVMRIEVRLEDVGLRLTQDASTHVAALIKAGALDLSRPGNLAGNMPDLPPIIAEAHGDRIVLDFMRHPQLAKNADARARIGLLTSLITVHGIETEDGHLDVHLRAVPRGVFEAATRVGSQVVLPGLRRARLLLPGSG